MPSQFEEYKKRVYQTYLEKKQKGILPLNLEDPKPANLRDECLVVLSKRYLPSDNKILNDFFGPLKEGKDYAYSIYQFDLNYFKPLQNFLKGKTKQPESKNINLLAWLIGFEDRPFKFDYKMPESVNYEANMNDITEQENDLKSVDANSNMAIELVGKENIDDVLSSEDREKKSPKNRLQLNYFMVVIAIIFIGFSIAILGGWINVFKKSECMYWKTDHYESIACNDVSSNLNAIAIDENRLEEFKKLMRLDTLREDCVGKIWYSKIDNKLEFFTSSGKHPVHFNKGLKIVTPYIYKKYILKRDSLPSSK